MKAMETIEDLIEEAKVRFVWWALCIFSINYFLSHTSSSMWMNFPVAVIIAFALRILFNEVEIHWKAHQSIHPQSYLSHLEKKQLSVNDTRLSSMPPPPRWKRKIDSPVVESAINNFIDLVLKDFVVDLWYSEITPDREAPELMRAVVMDAIGEISTRIKQINLVDLLTRDIVDLVGDHLDLFRRNQATIGVDVMRTLSTEERDERLKHHLMASKELHPALVSLESEYKVLQRLIGAVLAIVLRSREVQSPLVRTIAREIVTCLVLQPAMNLASPAYINEVIEDILLAINDTSMADSVGSRSAEVVHCGDSTSSKYSSLNSQGAEVFDNKIDNQTADMGLTRTDNDPEGSCDYDVYKQETLQPRNADWVRMLEAATQRRTEVLAPENLENLWTKGRNYKRKDDKNFKSAVVKGSPAKSLPPTRNSTSFGREAKTTVQLSPLLDDDNLVTEHGNEELYFKGAEFESASISSVNESKSRLKRSSSTSALKMELREDGGGPIISEFYSPDFSRYSVDNGTKVQDTVFRSEGPHVPKLRCRVMGAYFEKLGSKSFAVYSIAVTDSENRTWFVKRRYRNFERLHRYLKEIPNYTLHLPPKRIFSSSTEDAFVHQRCIQLDKYLQDLLSIANVAEQHEVWDFLSVSSKNYSFGKSSSVMRTLAVNVDDAVDDIVRQFKGGFRRRPVDSSAPLDETSSVLSGNSSWHTEEMSKDLSRQDTLEVINSSSDNEERHKQECLAQEEVVSGLRAKGWHSDNELNLKCFPQHVIKQAEEPKSIDFEKRHDLDAKAQGFNQGGFSSANNAATSSCMEDPIGMPAEWTPPNVSVPLLNLVDKVFQLKRRGWLRRQVFWISKQILQLVMEDAIDDWLLRQIYWLRREETVVQGIRWLQDVLWPNGTFFTRVGVAQSNVQDGQQVNPFQVSQFGGSKASKPDSFEEQLEAARRVSNIKKLLFDGAPTALVSLIGNKQYKRCARDIFYFTQSTICVKQLAYGILEVLLLSVFPELRDILLELHGKMPAPPA